MIPDNGRNVIFVDHKHGRDVYNCTVANARALVKSAVADHPELQEMIKRVESAKSGEGAALRSHTWLESALAEVATLEPGASLKAMRRVLHGPGPQRGAADTRPEVLLEKAWQDELVLWCFQQKINFNPGKLGDAVKVIAKLDEPLQALSFLKPAAARFPKGLQLVSDYYLEGAEEYSNLCRNAWKESAEESAVVMWFIRFLNNWGLGRWDVLTVQNAE